MNCRQQSTVGAVASPSPHQKGQHFRNHYLGRPYRAALFLAWDVATSPLMNGERFRLIFESKVILARLGVCYAF